MSTQVDKFTGVAARLTPAQRARIAVFRFGLGPKPGLIERLSRSPNAAFDACWSELTSPTASTNVLIPRPTVNGQQLTAQQDYARSCFAGGNDRLSSVIRYEELARRYVQHLKPDIGFAERLVLFWANHFSMHFEKSVNVRCVIGHFERTVVRANVLGRFPAMLVGAVSHPSLIAYLDNQGSSKTAINENLAREILELHTLGTTKRYPNRTTGYDQDDVRSMARILTGWSIFFGMLSSTVHHPDYGQFSFKQNAHDETPHRVFGQTFSSAGQQKGIDALNWLGVHPFTAENIATKLLRHFAFDDPPNHLVTRLQKVFVQHQGNLLEVSKALLQMEEVWAAPLRIRPPHLWAVAMARGLGFAAADFTDASPNYVHNHWQSRLEALDNNVWAWPTPDGYPDRDSHWIHPDAIRMRPNVAIQILRDAHNRGYVLPNPDTLRGNLLPGNVRVTSPAGGGIDNTRSQIADIFLTTEFMTR
jgi:uncharacterized protein (DUF1800 family)